MYVPGATAQQHKKNGVFPECEKEHLWAELDQNLLTLCGAHVGKHFFAQTTQSKQMRILSASDKESQIYF